MGEKNYKWFILLISFFLVHNLIICLAAGIQILNFHITAMGIAAEADNFAEFYKIEDGSKVRIVSYACCWLLILVCGVKSFTTAHLIYFHIYLRRNNLTTYKYIMLQRRRKVEHISLKLDKEEKEEWNHS